VLMIKLYHYPQCSTCRKARRWLEEHGVEHELVDIVKHPPTKSQLAAILRASGKPVAKLFNTSGVSYREGDWKTRLAKTSESAALDALAADGKLIKRPLLVGDGIVLVGFREDEYAAAF